MFESKFLPSLPEIVSVVLLQLSEATRDFASFTANFMAGSYYIVEGIHSARNIQVLGFISNHGDSLRKESIVPPQRRSSAMSFA